MHDQLEQRVKSAKDDMIRDPDEESPACPVAPTKHKYSANNREQSDKTNEDNLILKWTVSLEFSPVINKSDCPHYYEQPADNRHRKRTLGGPGLVRCLDCL
jgi:hypothetical protein